MTSHDEGLRNDFHKRIASHLKSGAIEVVHDKDLLSIEHHFEKMGFPRKVEEILWETVPNSEHYVVKIPTRLEESRDFTNRIIQEYKLKGPVILYGDYFLMEEYRMNITLLPSVLWDFIQIPICLYVVNVEQNWCFSYHDFRHLNFGFAPEKLPA